MIARVVGLFLALCLLGVHQGEKARGAVDELTLEQQVGQVLVLSFSGPAVPEYARGAPRASRRRRDPLRRQHQRAEPAAG